MSKFRIVIDGRMFQESGIGRYIRNLVRQLQDIDEQNEYFILHLKKDYDTLEYHNNLHKVLADFRWYGITEQFKLPQLLKSLKPDLVHFPHFNVPLLYDGKFVVTIHDLIHQHFQMRRPTTLNPLFYKVKQLGYKKIFRNVISRSSKILVPSEFVKSQLMSEWQVGGDKVVITPEAVDNNIAMIGKLLKENEEKKVMEKFNIKKPYIFYVGNAHPHKNVEGLIKAYFTVKRNHHKLKLVLAGHNHYFWERIKREFQHKDIIYAGFISDEELVALYKNAECFVMPSFEEGFGIPILEAFACSCPVVASKAGALPEVGADAVLYFNPHNREDMMDKIDQVLRSEKLRQDFIKKGHARVKLFSWEKLAKKTQEAYKECV